MSTFFKRLERSLLANEALIILLFFVIVLRIPNLFEPYWYGDETIYLTIGNALRNGLVLYRDIVDHKTPIIYLLAMVPSLFWFKSLLLGFSIISSAQVFLVAKSIFGTTRKAFAVGVVFAAATCLPVFEGNIANGELFVMGFITTALWIFSQTSLWKMLHQAKNALHNEPIKFFLLGSMLGLAILTKVPAVLDYGFYAAVILFALLQKLSKNQLKVLVKNLLFTGAGIAAPILISIFYFSSQHALDAYLQYGLLYNLHYSKSIAPPFNSPLLQFLFGFSGKSLLLLLIFGSIALFRSHQKHSLVHAFFFWFFCTLFAALLSSRPYPHYWLQTMLPLSFLAGYAIFGLAHQKLLFGFSILALSIVLLLFKVSGYPTIRYYQRFILYASKQLTKEQYMQEFDPIMLDTYRLSEHIQSSSAKTDRLFVWGTNPALYALSRRIPAGRFIVSFHIKDFHSYDETLSALKNNFPEIIVVIANEDRFEALNIFLTQRYLPTDSFGNMQVFHKLHQVQE